MLKRYPVAAFFILAYGLTWLCCGLGAWLASARGTLIWAGAIMPAVSAVVVLGFSEGRAGVEQLLRKLVVWRVGVQWYLVALLSPLAILLMALPFHTWLGGRALPALGPSFWAQALPSAGVLILLITTFGILISAGEEAGWRGYALPRLQARFGFWQASLILGLLWGCWHLPLFLIPGTTQYGLAFPAYVLASIGYSVIYTCLYNRGRGSVLLASLFHSASNATISYAVAIVPFFVQDMYLSLPGLVLVALIVVGIGGYLTTETQRHREKSKFSL